MADITFLRIAAVLAFFFCIQSASAQDDSTYNSFGVDVRYTSGSRLFPEPFSPDPLKSNATNDLGEFFTAAGHYRRRVTESLELQLTGEYLTHDHETADNYGTITSDGFRIYGVELLALFRMPFSTERVGFYAGGGGGFVYGDRKLTIAGIEAASVKSDLAFGIHVVFGLEYFFTRAVSLRGEFHFRDPQIEVQNQFPVATTQANGITYRFPTDPIDSKINLNGNVYSLGLSWHW